jgi:hypothetical protein
MAKGTTRHHHYVSQFYLRQFANERGQLCVFDRTKKTPFATIPRNVTAERDFNSVDIPGVKFTTTWNSAGPPRLG